MYKKFYLNGLKRSKGEVFQCLCFFYLTSFYSSFLLHSGAETLTVSNGAEEDDSPTEAITLQPATLPIYHWCCLTITGFGKSGLIKCNLFRRIKQIFVACHIQLHRHGRGPWKRLRSRQGNRKIDADWISLQKLHTDVSLEFTIPA